MTVPTPPVTSWTRDMVEARLSPTRLSDSAMVPSSSSVVFLGARGQVAVGDPPGHPRS